MAEWKELILKGSSAADLDVRGAAQGNLLMAGANPFTYANLTAGAANKVLTANGVAAALTWETPTVYAPATGAAQGNLLMAGADPFTYANLTGGSEGEVLTAHGAAAALTWSAAGSGDFKADGTVAMTNALRLKSNAGEGGMVTTDGAIFFDTTADKVKVYVA